MQCDILEKQTKPHVIKENLKQIGLHYGHTGCVMTTIIIYQIIRPLVYFNTILVYIIQWWRKY